MTFESSDSIRTAGPLKHAQQVTFDEPLALELGGVLPGLTVAFETYGTLNADRSNAVLICHALTGDSHVARHDDQDEPGWWDASGMIGSGRYIDTDKYFVVCPNILGGCRGTTGPNTVNPATGRPYGSDFPTITIGDMVNAQARLIDHLGIDKLLAVIGGSMGGYHVLTWATQLPGRVCGAVAIATSPRLTSQALAFDVVGRNAIMQDPNFDGGRYQEKGAIPAVGLAIARMIGHITYLSPEAMQEKFDVDRLRPRDVPTEFEKKFSVGSYLGYQGAKFVERFDANSYIKLTMAMDLFDLGQTPAQLQRVLAQSQCRWLVVSFTSDWLFPPSQSQDIVDALLARDRHVTYVNVASGCGHDAFLLPDEASSYGGLTQAFLANLCGGEGLPQPQQAEDVVSRSPISIFSPQRVDYDRIVELIPPETSVLDLGCGSGTLLSRLRSRGHARLMGVELDEKAIISCARRGLDVIQGDLNQGLSQFTANQFDFVTLSQTLQAVRDVERIVGDMLRVGRRCIVSFPNFGYRKVREMLVEKGKAPATAGILRFKWYNSPNIRFLSIADFEEFCTEKSIKVHRCIALDTEQGTEVQDHPNLNADMAIFVISR